MLLGCRHVWAGSWSADLGRLQSRIQHSRLVICTGAMPRRYHGRMSAMPQPPIRAAPLAQVVQGPCSSAAPCPSIRRSRSRSPALDESQSRPVAFQARRWDAPVVVHSRRGSRTAALAAAAFPESQAAALHALETDRFAASAVGPRASLLRTWIEFHTQWFLQRAPAGQQPLPVFLPTYGGED